MEENSKKVLMICTGGTIGMLPKDKNDSLSPLVPASWDRIKDNSPAFDQLSFEVDVDERLRPIDSSDMNPEYWISIAKKIRDDYEKYSGFVILHGTDTMTYTATALSFLLENLDKPVIITGSQLPLAKARNDAAQNLVTALMLAASADGLPTVPEVCILFNNTLLRGNRSRKISSSGFAGFQSPNYRPLAEIGEHIKIDTKIVRKDTAKGFFINEFLDPNVMVFDIFPGISPTILRNVFAIEGLKGVILRTYGTGNAPTNEDFLKEIEFAITKKNLAVVNITQCAQGMVEMGLYDASAQLSRIGVISGVDMTPEAALVKMMFLLGQGYDTTTVKEQMQKDLRGEQSVNVFNFIYERGGTKETVFKLATKQLAAGFVKEKIVTANIRFDAIAVKGGTGAEEKDLQATVFMNYPSADATTSVDIPQCLGVIEKKYDGQSTDYVLECTRKVRQVIDPSRPVQLTVVSRNGKDISWDGAFLSIYTDVDI
ncbi:MAG: type I asparaginase [Candidatus Symbiothrix sp.]|jgi:L-asparaginase|nr:type I asparaginase [Candidatus Symbiothrix sp.]